MTLISLPGSVLGNNAPPVFNENKNADLQPRWEDFLKTASSFVSSASPADSDLCFGNLLKSYFILKALGKHKR